MLDGRIADNGSVQEVGFASGHHRLSGVLYRPSRLARGAAVINGATGVPQGFYRAFATWLSKERSRAVLTFDYREFGKSAVENI